MPSVSPIKRVGKYVSPKDWNILITDPNVVSYLAIDFWSSTFHILLGPSSIVLFAVCLLSILHILIFS